MATEELGSAITNDEQNTSYEDIPAVNMLGDFTDSQEHSSKNTSGFGSSYEHFQSSPLSDNSLCSTENATQPRHSQEASCKQQAEMFYGPQSQSESISRNAEWRKNIVPGALSRVGLSDRTIEISSRRSDNTVEIYTAVSNLIDNVNSQEASLQSCSFAPKSTQSSGFASDNIASHNGAPDEETHCDVANENIFQDDLENHSCIRHEPTATSDPEMDHDILTQKSTGDSVIQELSNSTSSNESYVLATAVKEQKKSQRSNNLDLTNVNSNLLREQAELFNQECVDFEKVQDFYSTNCTGSSSNEIHAEESILSHSYSSTESLFSNEEIERLNALLMELHSIENHTQDIEEQYLELGLNDSSFNNTNLCSPRNSLTNTDKRNNEGCQGESFGISTLLCENDDSLSAETLPQQIESPLHRTETPSQQNDTPPQQTETPSQQTEPQSKHTETSSEHKETSSQHTKMQFQQTIPHFQRIETPYQQTVPQLKYTETQSQHTETQSKHTETPSQNIEIPFQQTVPNFQHTETPYQHTVPQYKHTYKSSQNTETPSQHAETPSQHTETQSKHTETPSQHTETLSKHTETSSQHMETPFQQTVPHFQHSETLYQPTVKQSQHTETSSQDTETQFKHTEAQSQHTETSQNTETPSQHTETQSKHTKILSRHTETQSKHTEKPSQHQETPFQHTVSHAHHSETPYQHTVPQFQHTETPSQHTETRSKHTETQSQHTEKQPKYTETPSQHKEIPPQQTKTPSQDTETQLKLTETTSQLTEIPPQQTETRPRQTEMCTNADKGDQRTVQTKHFYSGEDIRSRIQIPTRQSHGFSDTMHNQQRGDNVCNNGTRQCSGAECKRCSPHYTKQLECTFVKHVCSAERGQQPNSPQYNQSSSEETMRKEVMTAESVPDTSTSHVSTAASPLQIEDSLSTNSQQTTSQEVTENEILQADDIQEVLTSSSSGSASSIASDQDAAEQQAEVEREQVPENEVHIDNEHLNMIGLNIRNEPDELNQDVVVNAGETVVRLESDDRLYDEQLGAQLQDDVLHDIQLGAQLQDDVLHDIQLGAQLQDDVLHDIQLGAQLQDGVLHDIQLHDQMQNLWPPWPIPTDIDFHRTGDYNFDQERDIDR